MNLHKELVARFVVLALRRQMRETSGGGLQEIPFSKQVPLWDVVADECIRQMEWARDSAFTRAVDLIDRQEEEDGDWGATLSNARYHLENERRRVESETRISKTAPFGHIAVPVVPNKLTLAPDDWKPEAS